MAHKAGTCSKFDIVTSRTHIKQLFSLCTLHVVGLNDVVIIVYLSLNSCRATGGHTEQSLIGKRFLSHVRYYHRYQMCSSHCHQNNGEKMVCHPFRVIHTVIIYTMLNLSVVIMNMVFRNVAF